jgi:hypothetical protein
LLGERNLELRQRGDESVKLLNVERDSLIQSNIIRMVQHGSCTYLLARKNFSILFVVLTDIHEELALEFTHGDTS